MSYLFIICTVWFEQAEVTKKKFYLFVLCCFDFYSFILDTEISHLSITDTFIEKLAPKQRRIFKKIKRKQKVQTFMPRQIKYFPETDIEIKNQGQKFKFKSVFFISIGKIN